MVCSEPASISGAYMYGSQPVPYVAARRMAASLRPDTQMGGWGTCLGLGAIETPEKLLKPACEVHVFSRSTGG